MFHVILCLFAIIEGADCHSIEKSTSVAPLDEEAFCILMAQVTLLIVAMLFLLCMSLRGEADGKQELGIPCSFKSR